MMEALYARDMAFYQGGSEMVVPPLSPVETASIVGSPDAAAVFNAFLTTRAFLSFVISGQQGSHFGLHGRGNC